MTLKNAPNILIVDDNEEDFLLFQRQIKKKWPDSNVSHAWNKESLINALKNLPVDLLVCDYEMPDLTHLTVHNTLKSFQMDVPFVILSDALSDKEGTFAIEQGIRDYVQKSTPERLILVLEREIHTFNLEKDKAALERAHRKAVYFDTISGFYNRQGFERVLSRQLSPDNNPENLCLLSVSLSKETLLAAALSAHQKSCLLSQLHIKLNTLFFEDIICKWSDNLIVVLFKGCVWSTELPTEIFLERLSNIELELSKPLQIGTLTVKPKLKLGLARPHIDAKKADELIEHAQSVASTLKSQNAPLVMAANHKTHKDAKRQRMISSGLRDGIKNNELILHFQPIYCLHTRQIVSMEALVRWLHPELGMVMPDEFISIAENSDLIIDLGQQVLENACDALLDIQKKGFNIGCAINCSTAQLLNQDAVNRLLDVIRERQIDTHLIEFEITETAAINNMPQTVKTVNKLKAKGCHVSLDDFGNGYSSLNYLRSLPLDTLKIDKSFIRDLLDDGKSQKIVKAVIDLGHAFDLIVHAEGIETAEQKQKLIDFGCDRFQGYFLSKPIPLNEMIVLLEDQEKQKQSVHELKARPLT